MQIKMFNIAKDAGLVCVSERHDTYVVVFSHLSDDIINRLATSLVRMDNDWIEVFGVQAELIHDTIDLASVKSGRQAQVGDGNPMTSWEPCIPSPDDLLHRIEIGHGFQDVKAVYIYGDDGYFGTLFHNLHHREGNTGSDPHSRDLL